MKHLRAYENSIPDETTPEYYIRHYKDGETFTSVNNNTFEETSFTGKEYRELFMFWYNKIKPYLDEGRKFQVYNILIDWDEETLAKFDMYSMLKNFFDIYDDTKKYNL